LNIDKNEAISDIVVNLRLKRLWDNIDLFRRSLIGKIEYTINSKGVPEISIRDYTPAEYVEMYLVNKNEVFVGVNELLTADVLNRCITQLWNSQDNIRKYI
jgi:hypothetical protein